MSRFRIHRGHMTKDIIRRLSISRSTSGGSIPVGSFRGWDAWTLDGTAWLFKGQRVLTCDWFEFCEFARSTRDEQRDDIN